MLDAAFSVAKRTLPYLDAYALGSLRYLFGIALFIALLIVFEGRGALRYEGRFGAATLFGLIGITGFNLFVFVGLSGTRGPSTLRSSSRCRRRSPRCWPARGQRPARFTLGCVVLAFAGVVLVVTKGQPYAAFEAARWSATSLFCRAPVDDLHAWRCMEVPWLVAASHDRSHLHPRNRRSADCQHRSDRRGRAACLANGRDRERAGWQIAYFSVGTVVLGVLGFNAAARRLGPLNTMLMLNFIPIGVFAIEAALGRSFSDRDRRRRRCGRRARGQQPLSPPR